MTAETLLQPLFYGLQMGTIYILIALGLTLIFSIMNVFNIAHGEFYMLGAFAIYYISGQWHVNYFLGLIIAVAIVGIIGVGFQQLLFKRVGEDMDRIIIIGIGLMWVLQTVAQIVFGPLSKSMAEPFSGQVSLLNVDMNVSRIVACAIGAVFVVVMYFFVYKTKMGRAMQAIAQDRNAAALLGIDVEKISAIGFGLGCGLAAAAGAILAPIYSVQPTMGALALTTSIAIIILGGLGSIPGAAIGGLILGLVQSYGARFLGYPATLLPFAIILLVLLFKRTGLMGKTT